MPPVRDDKDSKRPGDKTRRAILVVTPWKRRWEMGGGAGLADDYHFIRTFTTNGFDVHYVSPRDQAPPDVELPGYHVHAFPNFFDATTSWPTPIRRVLWPVLLAIIGGWRAWRVSRRVRPDVVLAQTHVAAFVAYFVASLSHVPSMVKLFGVMDLMRADWPALTYLAKNFEAIAALKLPIDAWIILDDGTRGDEAARRHGVHADRIHFLPNGVNLEWQARDSDAAWFRNLADVPDGHDVVLYLARLADWKRPEAFVRAAAKANPLAPRPVVWVVAGEGPEQARCEALARELGVGANVRFVGPVAHDRIPDAFAATSLFVATSERSNKSIATCEALLCGVPVVAFDVGETHDVVRNGETGVLVRDGRIDALADAIVALLKDDDRRALMGKRALSLARNQFIDWEKRTEIELEIVRALIGRGV